MGNDAPWKKIRYTPSTGTTMEMHRIAGLKICRLCRAASPLRGDRENHIPGCPSGSMPFETGYADRLEHVSISMSVAGLIVLAGVAFMFGLFTGWVLSWP